MPPASFTRHPSLQDDRVVRNIYVALPDPVVERLRQLAAREYRGTKEQAAVLILEGLRRHEREGSEGQAASGRDGRPNARPPYSGRRMNADYEAAIRVAAEAFASAIVVAVRAELAHPVSPSGATPDRLYSIDEGAAALHVVRSTLSGLIGTGELRSVKVGRRRLVRSRRSRPNRSLGRRRTARVTMKKTAGTPSRQGPGRDDDVHVDRADILTVTRNVRQVFENVHLLADEGLVEFDGLDLRPSLAILDGLTGERSQ